MTTLRGSRGFTPSFSKLREKPASRRMVRYACPKGHEFEMPFAAHAEASPRWACRQHGVESTCIDGGELEQTKAKPPRTHWDMLWERRTLPQLQQLLDERLALLHSRTE
ncbi:RNA polymerase-binding protein RbpA [Saccharopolyspora elongata]|uniref:RNA polymerase-binding protein RbpA n=1 Tax=Saccharopolyspora elongata TaxID=2530387 RepID=A0A4R4Y7F3_9PSEU|nr:RNA polymerase-binding protein RbpA [Saccharopolyspora elongata]TDD40276.1 RNA polymerase-binding protein RbpA [Saccharopolyspora elongata]